MASQADLHSFEKFSLSERIGRIEKLLEKNDSPKPFELGLLLALKIAEEMKSKKTIGEGSGQLVAEWTKKYPESIVEEAISSARAFLLNPSSLMEKLRESILARNQGESNV